MLMPKNAKKCRKMPKNAKKCHFITQKNMNFDKLYTIISVKVFNTQILSLDPPPKKKFSFFKPWHGWGFLTKINLCLTDFQHPKKILGGYGWIFLAYVITISPIL
jgi:hypothetical protein